MIKQRDIEHNPSRPSPKYTARIKLVSPYKAMDIRKIFQPIAARIDRE